MIRIALVFLVALAFVADPLSTAYAGRDWKLNSPVGAQGLAYEDPEIGLAFNFTITERSIEINVENRSTTEVSFIWNRSRIKRLDGSWDNVLTSVRRIKKRDAFSLKEEDLLILQSGRKFFRALVPVGNRVMSSLSVMGYEVKELAESGTPGGALGLSLCVRVNGLEKEIQFLFAPY